MLAWLYAAKIHMKYVDEWLNHSVNDLQYPFNFSYIQAWSSYY